MLQFTIIALFMRKIRNWGLIEILPKSDCSHLFFLNLANVLQFKKKNMAISNLAKLINAKHYSIVVSL